MTPAGAILAAQLYGEKKTCAHCGRRFERPRGLSARQWSDRLFCGRLCSAAVTAATRVVPKRTHGDSHSPTWWIWNGMRRRCSKPTTGGYKNYGGRGIRVCDRWQDYAAFLADMGPRPSPKHSIDRINNNGDYEPGNVRWATAREQSANTSVVVLVEFAGQNLPLSEWGRRLGTSAHGIKYRLSRWPIEIALDPDAWVRRNKSRGAT